MQRARYVLVGASLVAALLLLASGPGTRAGIWEWQSGFALMRWAMYVGFATAAIALVMLIIPKTRGPQPTILVAALLMGIMTGAPVVSLRTQAGSLPPIHDITTDVRDPPGFVALLAARKASPNGSEYGGPEIAAQQAKAYPNVRPMLLPLPPQEAFTRAADVARAMGWEIVSADAATGRIEATATTLWFGFRDDIVVRILPQGTASRIDVRSVSRVGRSDVGANARRIQEYLSKLT
jgi:uncharacterized protein (DUF1499 family)